MTRNLLPVFLLFLKETPINCVYLSRSFPDNVYYTTLNAFLKNILIRLNDSYDVFVFTFLQYKRCIT